MHRETAARGCRTRRSTQCPGAAPGAADRTRGRRRRQRTRRLPGAPCAVPTRTARRAREHRWATRAARSCPRLRDGCAFPERTTRAACRSRRRSSCATMAHDSLPLLLFHFLFAFLGGRRRLVQEQPEAHHATAVHLEDTQCAAAHAYLITDPRDPAEPAEHETAHRRVVLVRQL